MQRSYIRTILLIALCSVSAISLLGQVPYEAALVEKTREATHDRKDKLRAYRIKADVGAPYQVQITDSLTYGTHRSVSPEGHSIGAAYAGSNANSPWLSHIFFDREGRQQDFVYLVGFKDRRFTPERATFYDTRIPFTYIHYRTNYNDPFLEEVITGTLSFNLGKRLNLGASVDHVGALGYYESGHSRNTNYRLFGSYRSDRYDLWLSLGNDDQRQNESGGIANLDYIRRPDNHTSGRIRLTSKDVPVHLPGNLLYNRLTSGHAFLSHRYKLGHKRTIQVVDSVEREAGGAGLPPEALMPSMRGGGANSPKVATKEAVLRDSVIFVPVGSISHQLSYMRHRRLMRSGKADERWLTFFGEPKRNITRQKDETTGTETISVLPHDQVRLETLHNTFSLSLVEGFRPWVKAGLSAYLRTENSWIYRPDEADATRLVSADRFFSAFAGAELSRVTGQGLNFALRGELGVLGRDIGAIKLEGEIRSRIKIMGRDFAFKADGSLYNMRPSYLAAHHQGTWGVWDKDFHFVRRLELGTRLDLASWGTWAELRTASLQNHLYWTRSGEAMQHEPLVQTTMLRLGHRYQTGALGWAIEGAYQLSTDETVVPLPALTAHADLFLDFYIAKVLRAQIGVEGYWHTAYYAPYYHPAVMQFVQQEEAKVGGKEPLLSAYASFRHKNTRFYVKMFNVGEALFSSDRQTMYNYVYNPMGLQIGLVVDLKN